MSAAAAVLLAGCSNAVERFSENPSDSDPVYTASVPKQADGANDANAADDQVITKPLAQSSLKKPYTYQANTAPIYQKPVYKAPEQPAEQTAEQITDQTGAAEATVTVGHGMTLYSIAKSNRITVSRLAAANHLKAPYAVHQGQVLRIPGAAEAMAPGVAAPKVETQQTAKLVEPRAEPAQMPFKKAAAGGNHEVASGDTLYSIGRKFGVSPFAIADLNGLPHNTTLKLGQKLRIPSGAKSAMASAGEGAAAPKATGKMPVQTAKLDGGDSTAVAGDGTAPTKDASVAQNVPAPDAAKQGGTAASGQDAAPAPQVTADASGMRWPVRGKVISEFGTKPGGLKNEGINIAVPEGTSVRAADDGVVAYAGNELKGYGNLVLIRHANGYVTAYAHAKELFVKRGDAVKRGDVIAKAGQTGSVSSPQLHFEVRKGAVAMDPLKYLDSTTASN